MILINGEFTLKSVRPPFPLEPLTSLCPAQSLAEVPVTGVLLA